MTTSAWGTASKGAFTTSIIKDSALAFKISTDIFFFCTSSSIIWECPSVPARIQGPARGDVFSWTRMSAFFPHRAYRSSAIYPATRFTPVKSLSASTIGQSFVPSKIVNPSCPALNVKMLSFCPICFTLFPLIHVLKKFLYTIIIEVALFFQLWQ